MKNLVERLEKRGWHRKEITKAVGIMQNARKSRLENSNFLERRIHWLLLFVVVAANFSISVALIPVLMALKGAMLYLVIAIIALVFGFLFELVIRSIEHLQKEHHLLLAIVIPAAAISNIFLIVRYSNNLDLILGLKNHHNPLLIGIVYAASFVIPYIAYRFVLKKEYYSRE